MSSPVSDVSTRIKTREQLEEEPYGFRVEWIEWDSHFRNSDLQIGDLVVGANDKRYQKDLRNKESMRAVGGVTESTFWAEQQAQEGQTVTLHILRHGSLLEIQGKLVAYPFYYDKEQKGALAPGGPARLTYDGFFSTWSSWYETFVKNVAMRLEDPIWEKYRIDNLKVLEEHEKEKERVDFLLATYPGLFADTVKNEWQRVYEILKGRTYTDINEEKLDYRQIGEQRQRMVMEASLKTRDALREEVKEQTISPFPAMDPIMGDLRTVSGKIVELPYVPIRQFINDLGSSYIVNGSREGYYIIPVDDPEVQAFFTVLNRYQAQVAPQVPERYQFFAQILPEPMMVTYERKPITGIRVKTLAGMAGSDHFFTDLRNLHTDTQPSFAGQELLTQFTGFELKEEASPETVMKAFIYYIKYGDTLSWRSLFSSWRVFTGYVGPPIIDTAYTLSEGSYQSLWEQSRKLILGPVFDVRVLHTGPIRILCEADAAAGIPKVERVKVILDHVGKVGNEYRSISNINVHRKWTLLRVNGGAWKIEEPQSL